MTGAGTERDLLSAALAYAARGMAVFPLAAGKKIPLIPKAKGGRGVWDATTDVTKIQGWWSAAPRANIGVAAGASGLLLVDVDAKNGRDGFTSWEVLRAEHLFDDTTPHVWTPNNGKHLWFAAPAGVQLRNTDDELGPGIETKANGKYCVAPPSRLADGRGYRWDERLNLDTVPIAPLPQVLCELLKPRERAARPATRPAPRPDVTGDLATVQDALRHLDPWAGGYDWWLAILMAIHSEFPGAEGLAVAGAWADGKDGEVEAKWQSFEADGGVTLGTLYHEAEARGWRPPWRTRRGVMAASDVFAPDRPPTGPDFTSRAEPAQLAERFHEPAQSSKPAKRKLPVPTDDELSGRWLAANPDTAWGMGEFRRYKDGIWVVVPLDVIRNEVKTTLEAAKADGVRPTARLLASVLELARIEIAQPNEKWDADPDILICSNGALHIPTRTLGPHSQEHWATTRLAFAYDPAAQAATWQHVLGTCCPVEQDFLQEFAGYALTPDTRYEIAIWLAGQPGSGKSTVLEGLRAMLGERSCLLGLADIQRSRFALTNLPGKTLAISTEQPAGCLGAVETLNAIISGEPITVDRKFREPVSLVPRAKIAWALNELPRVGSEGAGLFRRVKVLRFQPLLEAARDPEIKQRVKQEGAGILNWALDGLARLRLRQRFEIPVSVQAATATFQEANDIPAAFVRECCVTGDSPESGWPYRTQGSVLYGAYCAWCKANGHKSQSSTSVAEDWRRFGFEKYEVKGKSWWRRVGLVDAPPPVPGPPDD